MFVQALYAWRGLVVASPIWYPNLSVSLRVKLLNFVKNVLLQDRFNLIDVNSYFVSIQVVFLIYSDFGMKR